MKGLLLCIAGLCVSGLTAWKPERQNVPVIETLVPECRADQLAWLWPNFNDATRFYQCAGVNWAISMHCAPGTKFMYAYQNCLLPSDWVSPQPPTSSTSPTKPPRGLPEIETLVPECRADQLEWLWPNFKDATKYYQCGAVGWVLSMPCAGGTKFDFKQQVCVHSHEWVSPQQPTISTTASSSPSSTEQTKPSVPDWWPTDKPTKPSWWPTRKPTLPPWWPTSRKPTKGTTVGTGEAATSSSPGQSIPTIPTPAPTLSTSPTLSTPVATPPTAVPTTVPTTIAPNPPTPSPTTTSVTGSEATSSFPTPPTPVPTTRAPDAGDTTSTFPVPPTPAPTTSAPEAEVESEVTSAFPTPPTAAPTIPTPPTPAPTVLAA